MERAWSLDGSSCSKDAEISIDESIGSDSRIDIDQPKTQNAPRAPAINSPEELFPPPTEPPMKDQIKVKTKTHPTSNRGAVRHEINPIQQVDWFERTFEQNEELGLNDMNTDDYETLPEGYVRPPIANGGDAEGAGGAHLIPHRVGTDHPTAFTKGQEEEDNTATDGGVESTDTTT